MKLLLPVIAAALVLCAVDAWAQRPTRTPKPTRTPRDSTPEATPTEEAQEPATSTPTQGPPPFTPTRTRPGAPTTTPTDLPPGSPTLTFTPQFGTPTRTLTPAPGTPTRTFTVTQTPENTTTARPTNTRPPKSPRPVTFRAAPQFPAGDLPTAVVIDDFYLDSKGLLDAVIANGSTNRLTILLGDEDETFVPGPPGPQTGDQPNAMVAADLSGDAIVDVATANSGDGTVSILVNNGFAVFSERQRIEVGGEPRAIALYGSDLAVLDPPNQRVVMLRNLGRAIFEVALVVPVGMEPAGLGVGDMNNDGILDLVVSNEGSGTISVIHGRDEGFDPPYNIIAAPRPGPLAIGDLNLDGRLDIAVTRPEDNEVAVFLSDPILQYVNSTTVDVPDRPRAILIADDEEVLVNDDGRPDILVLSEAAGTLTLLRGEANDRFRNRGQFTTGRGPLAFATGKLAADIDEVGDETILNDFVVANSASNSVTVLKGRSGGGFRSAISANADAQPAALTTGDFNRDGNLDVLVVNPPEDRVSLIRGSGTGNFFLPTPIPVVTGPRFIVTGDFDGDENEDFAIISQTTNAAHIYRNDGAGRFTILRATEILRRPAAFAAGDLDGDGADDLVIADADAGEVVGFVNLNGSTSGLRSFTLATGGEIGDVMALDLNADGRVDIAATVPPLNRVLVWEQTIRSTFAEPIVVDGRGNPRRLASADINHDGRLDLVSSDPVNRTVNVMLQNGDGTFGAPQTFAALNEVTALLAADFNRDQIGDVATLSRSGDSVSVLLGDGTGALGFPDTFAVGGAPLDMRSGAFNPDFLPDIVVASTASDQITILRNSSNVAGPSVPTRTPTATAVPQSGGGGGGCQTAPASGGPAAMTLLAAALGALLRRRRS